MSTNTFFPIFTNKEIQPHAALPDKKKGKVYADIPHSYFDSLESLKRYVLELKEIGVNVLLILPHFLPSFSSYVVSDYEKPCKLFNDWNTFANFMKFVEEQGMDRMIDIPFNHCDWQAAGIDRSWFIDSENNGLEAGADDVDADGNLVRINWGAFILDNSIKELQDFWLEKVVYPHLEKFHVNSIRIDAAWGLDPEGLKRIVQETKKKFPESWFLTENLGMDKLINLAKSGIEAGADRFFNNMYWYDGGIYIPTDIYRLYKQSGGLPTCTIFSSHDVLMPSMKAFAALRSEELKGLNDKAIIRQFCEYEGISSIKQLKQAQRNQILKLMKLDFTLAGLMTSDTMFVAGSEKALFKKVDVCCSDQSEFDLGIESDFPEFMKDVIKIKFSHEIFNKEGVIVPFGSWKKGSAGLRGYVKSCGRSEHLLVATNFDLHNSVQIALPNRIKACSKITQFTENGSTEFLLSEITEMITIPAGQALIITGKENS